MKAIMISIKPKYVADIINGKKVIEIRKSVPKIKLPIDVYIYATKEQPFFLTLDARLLCYKAEALDINFPKYDLSGRVVAKFTLNKVEHAYNLDQKEICDLACITNDELNKYAGGWYNVDDLYAWRIDQLKVLEPVKQLKDFFVFSHKVDGIGYDGKKTFNIFKPLTRAPQSWCYIEI